MQHSLDLFPCQASKAEELPRNAAFGQWWTPAWAAEALFDAHFADLGSTDVVWEPTCGRGHMLAAVPAHIPCIGSEIDPAFAAQARELTGRPVLVGDCRTVELPSTVTAVFGNPPFEFDVFAGLLERCAAMLQNGQKAGYVLPAYFFQSSRTVIGLSRAWTISHEFLPRDLFPGLSIPLIFAKFVRDFEPKLIGFRLYAEQAAMRQMKADNRDVLTSGIQGPRSVWRELIKKVLTDLGGKGSLKAIYDAVERSRPTDNPHWREQIRKVARENFTCVERGVYELQAA